MFQVDQVVQVPAEMMKTYVASMAINNNTSGSQRGRRSGRIGKSYLPNKKSAKCRKSRP